MKKATLIGAGAVGTSALYSLINQKIVNEINIIDLNTEKAEGDALDFIDAAYSLNYSAKVYVGGYEKLKDSDIVIITAGRPQKPGETRLEMIADNAKIMKNIANSVKETGYDGVVLIASNPVDVMSHVFAEVSGYPADKVISSGTELDSARLRAELTEVTGIDFSDINDVFIAGEHGDSSVVVLDNAVVNDVPVPELIQGKITVEELQKKVSKKAYEIINRKGSTYYGIGAALAKISKAIMFDEDKIYAVSSLQKGENGESDVYFGILSKVGSSGVKERLKVELSEREKTELNNSSNILKERTKVALEAIK